MKPLYLLDGYSLIYRSYFAFIRNPLINPDGRNVSATFGFFRTLYSFFDQFKPEYFAVVMDSRVPTFRHEEYAEYKATREKAPQDLHAAVPIIEEILGVLGIPILRVDRFEADDIMATLAERCRKEGNECFIISGDKDLLQLVGGSVKVLKPDKGGYERIGPDEVVRDWGVRSDQILDYLALIGDTSDNVPGVRGIGPKSAEKLLADFDTLDGVYANLDKVAKGQAEKLAQDKENAYLSRKLVTLRFDVPLPAGPTELKAGSLQSAEASKIFQREGLKQLAVQSGAGAPAGDRGDASGRAGTTSAPPLGGSPTAFAATAEKSAVGGARSATRGGKARSKAATPGADGAAAGAAGDGSREAARTATPSYAAEPKRGTYAAVTDLDELDRWIARIRKSGVYAFDSETDDIDAVVARPVGFSIAVQSGEGCYIPLKAPDVKCLDERSVRERLKPVLEDGRLRLIGQNIKYDYKVLKRWGITLRPWFDTMLAAWLIDSTQTTYNMDKLAEWYLSYSTIHFEDIVAKGKTFDSVPIKLATDYAAEDADVTFRLYERFLPLLKERGVEGVLFELEMPLVPVLADMELEGIRVLPKVLASYSKKLGREIGEIEQQIFQVCGREFNLNSTKQLQEVLFHDLDLNPTKKTKTGFSTDTAVLEELAEGDGASAEVPRLLLRYRLLSKLKSTYVDALPKMINPLTGRIHTQYVQTGTATGRISSKDPNLQNIPIKDEEGRQIRAAFVPSDGHVFLSADYAQIELVVLAHLSGDQALSTSFREGKDVHSQTGSLIFGVPDTQVTPEQRRIAKTINFGVMYGMSAFRLSRELKIPRALADEFIAAYFMKYSAIRKFIDATTEEAKKNGYVRTLMGRIRPIPGIDSRNRTEQQAAQRVAVNTPIQGTAADIVKKAMLAVRSRLDRERLESRLILQVHDELVFEVPETEISVVSKLVREEMERAVTLKVPLRVSVETGGSWGALH